MFLVPWPHFCVGFITANLVLRSVTFFPSKICNKYTNIYGGAEEFLNISSFSKFKILKIFCPPFWGSGALAPYFRNSSVLPQALPIVYLRHPYATLKKYPRKSRKPKTFYNRLVTTYSGLLSGSPEGDLLHFFRPHCHAAFGTIPSTLAWIDQSPVSYRMS